MSTLTPISRAVALFVSLGATISLTAHAQSPATDASGATSAVTTAPSDSSATSTAAGAGGTSGASASGLSSPSGSSGTPNAAPASQGASSTLDVNVNAARLDKARNGLQPETGSSVYTIDQKAIQTLPAGQNTPLNQVL